MYSNLQLCNSDAYVRGLYLSGCVCLEVYHDFINQANVACCLFVFFCLTEIVVSSLTCERRKVRSS